MADTQFDEARANAWAIEVEGELALVDQLLAQVAQECEEQPYEDDTIMNSLHNTGVALNQAWTELGNQFKETIRSIRGMFSKMAEHVAKTVEDIANFVRNATN